MDLEYIRQMVSKIEAIKEDDEAAHSAEDELRAEFIALVAVVGSTELAEMAQEVLKTDQIKFHRLYA